MHIGAEDMQVIITKTFKGKDGGAVKTFEQGKTYDITDGELLKVIEAQKWGYVDVFAAITPAGSVPAEAPASEKEYERTQTDVRLLPVKDLKGIITEEGFDIDAKGLKQAELAEAIVEALKLKYKGF